MSTRCSKSKTASASLGSVRQCVTAVSKSLPLGAKSRPSMYWYVVSSGDEAHLGAHLDREVADGQAALDRERADGRAGVLDREAGAASGADHADQMQDHVLGRHTRRQPAVEIDAHAPGPALHQSLRCQHMHQLGRADAEGERAHAAMRARMAVAADDGEAGQAQPQLGADDVHDAVAILAEVEQPHAQFLRAAPRRHQQPMARREGLAGAPGLG
jgi:hypothetical protein